MSRASNNYEWVDSIKPCDVLFGRGSGPNDREGNILFRNLVKERKPEYISTNHRQTKAKIAQEIVDVIRARNGRFLRKAELQDITRLGIPEGADAWLCVEERVILEKAKQALRQKAADGKDRDEASSIHDEQVASSGINDVPYQEPSETMPHYHPPHGQTIDPPVLPDAHVSVDLYAPGSQQEPFDWRSHGGNQEPLPTYMPPSPQQGQYRQSHHFVGQTYLSKESPPVQRNADINPQHQGKELHHQRLSEEEVHRTAAAGYQVDESPIGDGPEDDGRRNSLRVEDLMESFHRMGTDEMAASSSSNVLHHETSSSNENTMGTIEPLHMGASNASMMSTSTASLLKGALGESNSTQRGRIAQALQAENERSGSSDMSLSFSNIDAMFDSTLPGSGRTAMPQVSQVLEGNEPIEDESSEQSDQKIAVGPRPVHLMEEDPDSMNRFGQSSMNILKSVLGDSGETTGFSAGKMGTDHKKES